jgi:hypothetical protein
MIALMHTGCPSSLAVTDKEKVKDSKRTKSIDPFPILDQIIKKVKV